MRIATVCFGLALVGNAVLLATPGFAQQPLVQQNAAAPPGTDVVVLNNGGMIRGVLIELLPGDHATVQLPSGQSAVIQWAAIHHVERGGAATPAATPAAVAPAPAPKPAKPPMTGPMVLVHMETPTPVVLYRMSADGDITEACTSPCDIELPIGDSYRIAGGGVNQSSDFRLEGQPGQRVVIMVNPGIRSRMVGGAILAGVGGLVAVVGVYVLYIGFVVNATESLSGKSGTNGAMIAGAVMMLAGAAIVVVGGVVALPNFSTSQSQEVQAKTNAMNRVHWFDGASPDRAPSMTAVPLFTRSF